MPDLIPLQHSLSCPKQCPACDHRRDAKLAPDAFGKLYFYQGAAVWLKETESDIAPKTVEQREYYIRTLTEFFGSMPLEDIHIGHIETFMERRIREHVGSSCIRHEVNCLAQIMERGHLWAAIKKDYKPPRLVKSKRGRALEEEEQQRLFTVACSNRRWKLAYWGSMVTASTTADHGEIRHLKLSDVNLAKRQARIRFVQGEYGKNEHRDRIVELNDNAVWALGQILKRYFKICRKLRIEPHPEHFILPGRPRKGGYDPTRPMGSWRKAWEALREKAGLPGLRMKDLRHTALTKLLENPELSERAIVETAGHVSKDMWDEYSHIRRKPKQEAVKTLEFEIPKPGPVESVETVDIPGMPPSNVHELKAEKKA